MSKEELLNMSDIDYRKILNDICKNKTAIHCKNEDEASDFLTKMGNLGVKWYGTQSNVCDNMNDYKKIHFKKEVCFLIKFYKYLNENVYSYCCIYGELEYFKTQRYKIIEWSNYMNYTSTLFLPKSLALGNVVVINGIGYIALSSDYENDDLSFYWIEDNGDIHTDLVSFYRKNISNNLYIIDCNNNQPLLYGGATIDRVYKNINDFKENKNELYNNLIDENQNMFYCILNSKDDSDEIIVSPNTKNYFDFSSNHTIKIQNNNNNKNNYITISPYQLTSFITTLNKLKQMYESHGINV